MAPSLSPDEEPLPLDEQQALLDIVYRSILSGLTGGGPMEPDVNKLPERLRRNQGAFVTLRVKGQLNGCIGSLGAEDPLASIVARVSWEAAFADFRLPSLEREDLERLHIEISVLSPLEPMQVTSEESLLAALRPGVDGLLIDAGFAHATFLPAVWKEYPEPGFFVRHLKAKAGLPPDWWSPDMKVFRYSAFEFGVDAASLSPPAG